MGIGRIITGLLALVVLGAIGLLGYSYTGLLRPDAQTITQPVELDVR